MQLMASNHTGDMVNGQSGRPAQGMGFGLSMQVVQDPVAANLRDRRLVRVGRRNRREFLGRAGGADRFDLFRPGRVRRRAPSGFRERRLPIDRDAMNTQTVVATSSRPCSVPRPSHARGTSSRLRLEWLQGGIRRSRSRLRALGRSFGGRAVRDVHVAHAARQRG